MQKIRKGDEVIVIAGKDKGRRGVVQKRVGADRVVVAGINVVKKHVRPNPLKGEPGGIVPKEMPIHISNVMLFNPKLRKGIGLASRFWKMVVRCGFSRAPVTW